MLPSVAPGRPDNPHPGPRRGNDDNAGGFTNGGGFINHRPGDKRTAETLRQHLRQTMGEDHFALLQDSIGDDGFERMQRSMNLSRNPRPLTDTERAVLWRAAAPLLADLAASGMPLPDIRDEAHEERQLSSVSGWVQEPDGVCGQGISVMLDIQPEQQVAQLAEQIQEWATDWQYDPGRPHHWPACPQHPDAPHQLTAEVRDDRAVWTCWQSTQVICPIGELTTPSPRP